ncbi:UDP-glucuronic acid decarboxylase 2 [Hordeum vulgare]|nr:UDP-glucuronic acid decarboxylase 2 [Hordeum vulgare]
MVAPAKILRWQLFIDGECCAPALSRRLPVVNPTTKVSIGVRSCYDEGKLTAKILTIDYHPGANLEVEGWMSLMEGDHIGLFNLGNPGEFTMLQFAKVV